MTKNFKNIKFNRLIRVSNGEPLKNTNGMPIAIQKPIHIRGNEYYDYMRAMQLGYKPDKTGHWPGRDYVTGDYLKLPGHPTIPLSVMYDVLSGYDVTRNEEGRYRSTPKKLRYSNYFQNGGVVGGGDPPKIKPIRVPINYNSYGGKLIRRKSTGGNISSKMSNVGGIAGFFQSIGKLGEGIGNSISEGAYDPNTGKYRTGQYAIGRGIYGAFNPLMAGIESINRKDTLLDTALAFSGLGNIFGANKYAKKINSEIDEKNNEIDKANKLELDREQQLRNLQSTYGTTNINNVDPNRNVMNNNFNAYGGKLNRFKRSMLKAFGGSTSNIPNSNAIPIDGNDELVVNNQGGTQGYHETGQNIPAYDSNGQETAQVEPGEVIMELPNGEKYALSKRLGVAQKYLEYIQIKEKLIQEMIATDVFKRNAIKREIDSIDAKIQQLPAYQEQLKQQYGIEDEEVQQQDMGQQVPMAKCGRKLGDGGFTKYDVPIQPEQYDDFEKVPYKQYDDFEKIPFKLFRNYANTNEYKIYNMIRLDDMNKPSMSERDKRFHSIILEKCVPELFKNSNIDNTNKLTYPDVPVQPEQLVDEPDYTKLINNYNSLLNAPYSDNTNIFNKSNTYTGKLNGNTIPNKSYINTYGGGDSGGGGSSTYTGGLNDDKSYTGEELYKDSLANRTRTPNKLFNPKNLGTAKDIATTVLPFVDNVINYAMIKKTPKIPKPILDKYTPLEERVNVENQISSIERSKKELFKDIDNNISNVQQANAMKREISRKADDAMNSIYEKKENTEIGMRNENKLRRNIIDSSNNRLLDAYNMAKAQREFGIMQDHSTNLANMSDDINNLMNRSDLKRNEKIELKAIGKFFNADVNSYLFEDLPEFFRMQNSDSLNKFIKESKNKRAVEFATNILKERGDLKE